MEEKKVPGQDGKIDQKAKGYKGGHKKSQGGSKSPRNGEENFSHVKSKCNDASWYAGNPQLLKDVASLSFPQMLGNEFSLFNNGDTNFESQVETIPGILVHNLMPALGAGRLSTDAPTVAARNIYTFVRHANSGHANYEAPDLMMMIMAVASANSFIEDMKRVYGVLMNYSARNRYTGRALVRAMGYNYEDLITHMADFRTLINISAARLNSIKVPANLPLATRWAWVSSNYFVDTNSHKAQLYFTKFLGFYQFDATSQETGSSLTFRVRPQILDLADARRYIEALLDPLMGDEDIGIMSGDIMKAYGDAVSSINLIPADYLVLPSDVPIVREQFHNSNAISSFSHLDVVSQGQGEVVNTVTQTADGVIVNDLAVRASRNIDTWITGGLPAASKHIFDLDIDSPSPEDVIVATRLMVNYGVGNVETKMYPVVSCGSEVPLGYTLWTRPQLANADAALTVGKYDVMGTSNTFLFSMLNRAPFFFITNADGTSIFSMQGEIDNYTVLNQDTLEAMHKVAILSECSVTARTDVK